MLLELPLPTIQISQPGTARQSSYKNLFYSNIGPISPFPLPTDLSGYNELPKDLRYHPLQVDPTIQLANEADAIRACQNYIIDPVNKVLHDNSYMVDNIPCRIRTMCEDIHSVTVEHCNGTSTSHVSRVDFSWEVLVRGHWYKFAFLEYKRQGALNLRDWSNALNMKGPVEGWGESICRQMVKYAYSWEVEFVSACDWDNIFFGRLRGTRTEYYNNQGLPPTIPAQGVWERNKSKMKRNSYVWVKFALKVKLQNMGIQV